MAYQTEASIILVTWFVLLLLYLVNRYIIKNRFLKQPLIITVSQLTGQDIRPGSLLSRIGVLFIFVANIGTFALVFVASVSPGINTFFGSLHVDLPFWINLLGSIFFILNAVWGLLVLVFNPNYTPLTRRMSVHFLLATQGPYAMIRHPRYAGEACLNIILFMFTGIWLPLLGTLGWIAMYCQARAEEEILITLAGEAYEKYRQRTGMFLPRLNGIHLNDT